MFLTILYSTSRTTSSLLLASLSVVLRVRLDLLSVRVGSLTQTGGFALPACEQTQVWSVEEGWHFILGDLWGKGEM